MREWLRWKWHYSRYKRADRRAFARECAHIRQRAASIERNNRWADAWRGDQP